MSDQPTIVAAIVTSPHGVLLGRRHDGKPPWTFIAALWSPENPRRTRRSVSAARRPGWTSRQGRLSAIEYTPRPAAWTLGRPVEAETVLDEAEATILDEGARGVLTTIGRPVMSSSGGPNRRSRVRPVRETPQGGEKSRVVRVRFHGFHCPKDSDWDQGTPSDEPYFIIAVASASGSKAQTFGPYEDADSGEEGYEAADVVSTGDLFTPPIVIGVVVMENDAGNVAEATAKVREAVEEVERKFDQVAGAICGAPTGNHVMPEWARDMRRGRYWLYFKIDVFEHTEGRIQPLQGQQ